MELRQLGRCGLEVSVRLTDAEVRDVDGAPARRWVERSELTRRRETR